MDAEVTEGGRDLVVDWAEAARNIPGGTAGLRRLAVVMREECPRLMVELRDGLAASDADRVRIAAHTLRGAALHFAAGAVAAVAAEAEASATAGDLASARSAVPRLEAVVDELVAALVEAEDIAEDEAP